MVSAVTPATPAAACVWPMFDLIEPNQNIGAPGEPKNNALHFMADLMWKF